MDVARIPVLRAPGPQGLLPQAKFVPHVGGKIVGTAQRGVQDGGRVIGCETQAIDLLPRQVGLTLPFLFGGDAVDTVDGAQGGRVQRR